MTPARALPRVFVPGCPTTGRFELPQGELDKLRKVLRLGTGDPVGVLPNDGTLLRCRLDGREAVIEGVEPIDTEPARSLTVLQSLLKGDKLDDVLRAGTEIGVARFVLFPSERTVVRWDDEKKIASRLDRAAAIVRESAELAFRGRLPRLEYARSLADALAGDPLAVLLDESDKLLTALEKPEAIVAGPEGGWTARERELFGDRRATLGPRVLRAEHAVPAAAALILLSP